MSPKRIPSETSPLLGPQSNVSTTGAIPNIGRQDVESGEQTVPPQGEQAKDASEAGKGLRYIIPAISLGVCDSPSCCASEIPR